MQRCKQGLEVKAYSSGAGYYLGTYDEDGPRCRISSGYAKTEAEALETLCYDRQSAEENRFCNGCGNCEIRRVKE